MDGHTLELKDEQLLTRIKARFCSILHHNSVPPQQTLQQPISLKHSR